MDIVTQRDATPAIRCINIRATSSAPITTTTISYGTLPTATIESTSPSMSMPLIMSTLYGLYQLDDVATWKETVASRTRGAEGRHKGTRWQSTNGQTTSKGYGESNQVGMHQACINSFVCHHRCPTHNQRRPTPSFDWRWHHFTDTRSSR